MCRISSPTARSGEELSDDLSNLFGNLWMVPVAVTWQSLFYCLSAAFSHADRVLPASARCDDRDAPAITFNLGPLPADHARRHLLRRAVRRLDHAILVNIPASRPRGDLPRRLQMARQGRAARARRAALGSFFAGCVRR